MFQPLAIEKKSLSGEVNFAGTVWRAGASMCQWIAVMALVALPGYNCP